MRKMKLLLSLWLISIVNLYSQTTIKDCGKQQLIANVVIYDAENKIIGVTDREGKVALDPKIQDITLVHPEYGHVTTVNQGIICLDELLDPIVITLHLDAKQELMDILQNTYKQYHIDPFDKQFFYYKGMIYENDMKGELLANEEGYLTYNSYFNTSLFISDKQADYLDNSDAVVYVPLRGEHQEYFFFNSKKQFNTLLKSLKKLKVKKINAAYYVYDNAWDNYWLFEVDCLEKRIVRFINTARETTFFDPRANFVFKRKSTLVQRLIEVNYGLDGEKLKQKLDLFEVYRLTNSEVKMVKYLKINTVDRQDVTIENRYSLIQYIRLHVKRKLELNNLAELKKKSKP
ncbi:hypothetical protein [Myroides odoratus]|uniref:Uncharacterized protein n=1 Tax=Myroides odoratus TaxID=256 RepID=A0A9Q6Z5Q5_MYROD|nr:hypothetical protein [Myroides odoratus]EHQ42689.1 hypothetical protein Myrod_1857 [Myroides odoratus DSM 2801]EKB07675.1 hypothetical protein HMPREF9716_01714 [Myroides odoratus CIP 103059]QQU00052.1 hypothetical protein I6I88_18120 [Myroides odoratus]WQD57728.1 hypothetical protein U0010_00830 [Myroides odoratus]STZ29952.1 Uncharacterised protein [Myroides odoratus]